MKKPLKLWACTLAVCGLAFVASCSDDDNTSATPAAPTGLAASSITDNSAVLSWTSDAPSFEIKVGDQTYTSSVSSYSVENLSPATNYTWSVKAVNGTISSEWVDGPAFTTSVGVPTNLTASSATSNSAVLSWTSDAPSFEIEVGSQTYTSSASSYTVKFLTSSTTYSWKVKAVNGEISSEWATGSDFATGYSPATVTFGSQVWSANATLAIVDFEDPYMQVQLYSTDPSSWESMNDVEYPFFQFFVLGNTVDNYSETNGYTPSYEYDVDYYHQTYINFGDEEDPWYVGDYWLDSDFPSSINITAVNASTISGTVNLTLIDVYTYDLTGAIINVPLSVAFADLPVTDYASLSVPFAASKNNVQNNPVLKPGKYPIKFNKNKEEKIKALKAKK